MRLRVYRDKAGEWRWRVFSRNGRIMADSGEGYRRQSSCRDAARKLFAGLHFGRAAR